MQNLVSIVLILLNGILAYLINQLPAQEKLVFSELPNSFIFWLTSICLILIIVLTIKSNNVQSPGQARNWDWVSSLLPLMGAAILYGLLKFNQVSEQFSPLVFYTSLGLWIVGVLLPVLVVIFRTWQSNRLKIFWLLYWVVIGIGVFGIIHFGLQGEWGLGFLSLCGTAAIVLTPVLVKIFDRLKQQFNTKIAIYFDEQLTIWSEAIANQLGFLGWEITSRFEQKYCKRLIEKLRDYEVEGYRIGLPTLDLEDVFVPLRVVTEIPSQIGTGMIQNRSETESQDIWEFLAKIPKISGYRCIAIIGSPGSGKTTLLQYLTLTFAKKGNRDHGVSNLLPVFFYLRDLRQQIVSSHPPNLSDLIKDQIRNLPSDRPLIPPANWLEKKMKRCLVMLDGLDEVADETERKAVSEWVSLQMENYRDTDFILTSRPHGYCNAPLEQIGVVVEVLPFNVEQVEQFIRSWYLHTEIRSRAGRDDPTVREKAKNKADNLIERVIYNRAIAEIAKNPLLVTMIAIVHYCGSALPGRRVELYNKICELLLGARQEAKNIKISLTAQQNKSILQVLALELMERKTRSFTLSEGTGIIQQELEKIAGTQLSSEQFIDGEIKRLSGLLVEREMGIYEFAHLSFQEYLAAVQIKEMQQDSLLVQNFQEAWWAETIRLYAAQSDATNLIREALKQQTVTSLTLAYDCYKEGLKTEPSVVKELENILEEGLESNNPQICQLAAEVKLLRRLNNLLKIDETKEIDTSYITCVEYQLFLNEYSVSGEYFQVGSAKKPITQISWEKAVHFCAWLSREAPYVLGNEQNQPLNYYRLPTASEAKSYPAKEHENLECWNTGENPEKKKGIRVVKTQVPCIFEFEVVSIDRQGIERKRKLGHSQYFTEDLRNEITLKMLYIPGGEFMMGSPEDEKGKYNYESPQHQVNVPAFYMSQTPITQAQWRAIASLPQEGKALEAEPSHFKGDDLPVESMSWQDTIEFCARLSRKTGRKYRLPSEAEWEYACRAGSTTPFHFGETITSKLANYDAKNTYQEEAAREYREKTTPVKSFPPNAFGLYDMHGNVWEWCLDPWHDNYEGAPTDGSVWDEKNKNDNRYQNILDNINVLTEDNRTYVLRGGSWGSHPGLCRSAYRDYLFLCLVSYGFRVVCVPR